MGWKRLITPNKGRDSSKMHFILQVILKMDPRFAVSIKLEWNHLNKNLIPNSCPDQPFWYFLPLIYCHCIQTFASHFAEITNKTEQNVLSLWALLWLLIIISFEWLSPWKTEDSNIIFFPVLILLVFDEVGSGVMPQLHSTLVPRKVEMRFHKSGRLLHFQHVSRGKSTLF